MSEDSIQPEASVKVENGIFMVRGSVRVEADPDVVHATIRDHEDSPRVFQAIRDVDILDKGRDHVVVTQHSQWRFLFWSGVYSVTLRFEHNPLERTTCFRLEKQGLMKQFNGNWTVLPCAGGEGASMVVLRQEIQLAINPPPPFGRFGCQIMANQVKGVLRDLASHASKSKDGSNLH